MRVVAGVLLALTLAACGGKGETVDPHRAEMWNRLGLGPESKFRDALGAIESAPIDPPPVLGRDYHPEFPPDLPFDPAAWRTTTPSPSVADPAAKKGGILRLATADFPPTLRTEGPNARLAFTSDIQALVYEPLLDYDMTLGDFVPALATHWWVSKDRLTYRFRLDPRARWADGRPVTADDVVATFEHLTNPDRKDPYYATWRDDIAEAKVLDRLTVEVRAHEARWRALLNLATQFIYPAAYIRMDGETYLREWNWKLPPGSGPYELRPQDVQKGQSITVRRRADWWAKDLPRSRGMYNFDRIRWVVIRDEFLTWQNFLADELDIFIVNRAQQWVDELDKEPRVRMGWIQRRKIYTLDPQGYGGYCFNMRKPPFNSRNVRLAVAHLFNREEMFSKFFFHQYDYMDSYFPGQPWARPDHERVHYDPRAARALLAKDGWTKRDKERYLVNDEGVRFPELTLEYSDQGYERIHDVLKNELWNQAGIRLNLVLMNDATLLKRVWEYQFTITYWYWTGEAFPAPEYDFGSKFADVPQSNNLNGFKDPEADRIIAEYQTEFDQAKRVKLLQRLDSILFDAHPYALGWYGPYFRVCYWDRFGHPPEYSSRYGRDVNNIYQYWWFDPDREAFSAANRAANRGNAPDRPENQTDAVDQKYWLTHELPMARPATK